MTTKERFTISHLGMREQHQGREPWELVKELVQNAWDEAPEATLCEVKIIPHGEGRTMLTVVDDGPGFADVADAYTMMKSTPKRADPKKRGRFNLGEKEALCVAIRAEISTVGHTVTFPEKGGRKMGRNRRNSGTEIRALMPWSTEQADGLIHRLLRFRPTECRLTVNGREAPLREPAISFEATMETMLQNGPGEPVRRTARRCAIDLLPPVDPEEQWIYEMGIPVQTIKCPWDVDILQKVPLSTNRTDVPTRYLKALYAVMLNNTHSVLKPEEFGSEWIKIALGEDRLDAEAVRATVKGRYGSKVLFISPNTEANMMGSENGYQMVNPKSLTPKEREKFKTDAGVLTSTEMFKSMMSLDTEKQTTIRTPHPGTEASFALYVRDLATACGLDATILIMERPDSYTGNVLADCSADSKSPTVRFNKKALGKDFFEPPYNRAEQLELLAHEFGHALAGKGFEHGSKWGRGVAQAAGMIAAHVAK